MGEVADLLRRGEPAAYVGFADALEQELGLAELSLDPAILGSIDTFRFEERLLLEHAAGLATGERYDDALTVVGERGAQLLDRPRPR